MKGTIVSGMVACSSNDVDLGLVMSAITKWDRLALAEIAANFMTFFYHIQVGALETQELRTTPLPYWLVAFSDTVKGPIHQFFFAIVLPDSRAVAPRVAERM